MKYVYPAVFHPSDTNGSVEVSFPDLEIATFGDSLSEAYEMAKDALCLTLATWEDEGTAFPAPSPIFDLSLQSGSLALIECDTDYYHRQWGEKPVRKVITIPAWLNTKAEQMGINFSQTLQEALKKKVML